MHRARALLRKARAAAHAGLPDLAGVVLGLLCFGLGAHIGGAFAALRAGGCREAIVRVSSGTVACPFEGQETAGAKYVDGTVIALCVCPRGHSEQPTPAPRALVPQETSWH